MWELIIIQPLTNLLLWIYDVLGHGPHMFGLAIILFTVLIKVVTWPLNASQVKGAQAMQELQNDKDWQEIQKKYAKDREKLAQEQMRIYKEKGINPFASCLPTLIQFPIIIGLYQAIIRAMAATPLDMLQLARTVYPFQNLENIIPLNSKFLWMNLGQPESIPVLGFALPTLAIVVALTTYVQTKLTMPATTNPNDQTAAMTGMMSIYMPLLLGWFALTFASGISVYFITSNILGIIQYAATGRANWRNLLPGGNKNAPAKK
ncbi:MAG TPA: YidC/Oxa1 family membrane protein insertase [Anaerolineales bacterium]|jgi:YidC/Oxa1 family membrane protein insertase|nr:protein translocase component YidC [Anaerolineae bacterium]HRJ57513.1 YidC/Oxa1 family membrane protein insertase [Anaerolineales bacterium]HRK88767.1 YidC/Oxa1 family membrane protein insertase [Anaerolineales bacterium]